ncbi:unnamed protein product, partial [Mesorhabditis belari]|uniref:Ell-associated factor Eaf n=1 Tax=Mesorhabditis belari TaxID=2138241 RepID=A0AAF3J1W9_9BILA
MSEIPTGEYDLKLGTTFTGKGKDTAEKTFHTLRYDFKPQSVSSDTDSFIAIGSNGDVQVVMPTSSHDLTVFKGSQKAVKAEKECLLFFDPATGSIRLEKLNSNITVKKTRDQESTENLRAEVERLRTPKKVVQEVLTQQKALPESDSSDSSDDDSSSSSSSSSVKKAKKSSSSSSSDSDSAPGKDESNSDDELSRALEDKILAKDEQEVRSKIHDPFADLDQPTQVYKPAPVHKSKTKDLMHDLQLSESSDED